jgi:hypothetical protein
MQDDIENSSRKSSTKEDLDLSKSIIKSKPQQNKNTLGDLPLPTAFARTKKFWILMKWSGILGGVMGLIDVAFLNAGLIIFLNNKLFYFEQ